MQNSLKFSSPKETHSTVNTIKAVTMETVLTSVISCVAHYNTTCAHTQCGMEYRYLLLMVDVCLCCNQTFNNWKMSLLAGDIQWCCTILEVKNSSEIAP